MQGLYQGEFDKYAKVYDVNAHIYQLYFRNFISLTESVDRRCLDGKHIIRFLVFRQFLGAVYASYYTIDNITANATHDYYRCFYNLNDMPLT